ncbi:hypothetical protein ScPMuIL_000034 [Solemya velum]
MVEENSPQRDVFQDEARINVLYSPFREKSLNPNSWEQKMKFWTNKVIDDSKKRDSAIIDMKTFPSNFSVNGRVPKCLDAVIDEMTRNGKIKKFQDGSTQTSDGWLPWCYNVLVKRPVSWGWNYVRKPTKPQVEKYVITEIIQEKASRVLQMFHAEMDSDVTDCVIEYSSLKNKCWTICQDDVEYDLVIKELVDDNKVVLKKMDQEILVKFLGRTDARVKPFEDRDTNIHCIKKSVESLQKTIDKVSEDIEKYTEEAKEAKRKGNTQAALRSLRHRKRARMKVERLTRSSDLLEDVLNRIETAVSEDMILQAISRGTAALKGMTSQMDMGKVQDTMDDVAEAVDDHEEIQSEMSGMSVRLGDQTQSELECELDKLLEDTQSKADPLDDISNALKDLELPDVPSFSPSSPKKDNRKADRQRVAEALKF